MMTEDVVVGYGMDADYVTKGFIVRIAIPFDIQIMKIIDFIESSIKDGTLYGEKKGNGAEKKLNKFKQMLVDIQYLIWDGNIADACQELNDAYKRADGIKPPADYVSGPAVTELENMIDVLINDMCVNCCKGIKKNSFFTDLLIIILLYLMPSSMHR